MKHVLDLTAIANGARRDPGVACFEGAVARWAIEQPDLTLGFAYHDAASGRIMELPAATARQVIAGRLRVAPDAPPERVSGLRRAWRHPRRAIRDLIGAPWASHAPEFTQADFESTLARILDAGSPAPQIDPRVVSARELAAAPLAPSPGDVLISLGSVTATWLDRVRDLKSRGVSYVGYCHDAAVATERADLTADLFWTADLLLTHAATDGIARFCSAHGIPVPAVAMVMPGCDIQESEIEPDAALSPGRHVLALATREPDLRFLHGLWRDLRRAERLARDIKLALAGDHEGRALDAIDAMARDPAIADSVEILDDVNDGELAWLFRHARFCIEPSAGAATAAALGIGKACLVGDDASADGFGPRVIRLAREDGAAWRDTIAALCRDDAALSAAQERAGGDPASTHGRRAADLFAAIDAFVATRR